MEPLSRGTGNEFHETVVGGAVPRQFIQSVEGRPRAARQGLLAGWPVVDAKVTLTDGKAHSVDSSDVAFQTAAALALKEMASAATMALLEPIDTVRVTVDDEFLGAIMTDASTRRGHIMGSEPAEGEEGRSTLTAAIPNSNCSTTPSPAVARPRTGRFARELSGYEQLPDRLAKEHLAGGKHSLRRRGRLGRATQRPIVPWCPPAGPAGPLGHDGEEVGVAAPPGHDVLVQVRRHACAGDLTLVHPDVESLHRRRRWTGRRSPAGEPGELRGLVIGEGRRRRLQCR